MAQLTWGDYGSRYFETGIDRAVLYTENSIGVAWNGLTAVNETPSGGQALGFYADGYKYLNVSSAEEYEATINAFSAPREFAVCDGAQTILNGLYITQQRRESFGFSYRTRVGNDVDGVDHGYKIHLVYNALAEATSRNYQTLGSSPTPVELSWKISTKPPRITGYRPSAHFIIDTRVTPAPLIAEIEGMLYGTSTSSPVLPSIPDIMELFRSVVTIQMMREQPNGSLALGSVPVIRSSKRPNPAPGLSTLWLDTSAGDYAKLILVTGE